jgi:putative proteasome-type protease
MTYCCGLMLEKGLVLMSDTRTNSGVDNISVFRKMFNFRVPGERSIALMTAGNLATTQAVISQLEERTKAPDERENALFGAETMFQVATEVGKLLRKTVAERQKANDREGTRSFSASIILAGQIAGMEQRLFLVYPEGNFIEASRETPFFQIGETKYGRPILLRGYDRDMSFEDAVKLLLVSFDSTIAANLSVGMPLDCMVLEKDSFDEPLHQRRFDGNDTYVRSLSGQWSESLRQAFNNLPDYSFYDMED